MANEGKTKSNKDFNSKIRTSLTCIYYFNARSLVNKSDCLRSEVMAINLYSGSF